MEQAALRGRGGSGRGDLAAARWRQVKNAAPGDRYVLANGAESSPGSRKDQHLLALYPHRVIEGAVAAARVVGAGTVYLYIKATAADALAGVESALAELADFVPDFPWPAFELFRAPDAVAAGEESAACDAIEGFEGRPQVKPPTPATCGILGRPTLVVNVETLAAAAAILRHGPEAIRTGNPKLITLSGDVHQPGVYEVALGTPIHQLIAACGGATGEIQAVMPGGYHSGPLTPAELDLPYDFDALEAAGTSIGLGHLVVLARQGAFADLMAGAFELVALGSCRQCEICAAGTAQLRELAFRIAAGDGDEAALKAEMARWAGLLFGKGNCGLPTGASALVSRAVNRFDHWREGTAVGRHD